MLILFTHRNRGLRSSLPRQCLSGIVILMLVASTSYAALTINFYLMQLPSILDREAQAALVPKLKKYNIAANWLSRLNVSIDLDSKEYSTSTPFLNI